MRKRKIIIIYFIAVLIYGMIVSLFSSTVHVGADEEIYLTLAKSFHYFGKFEIDGQLANYNCVLYSLLISLAYYAYRPESILFGMRIIGVLLMCSAVFPIFGLAKKVLEDEKKAFGISIITLLLPYMFDCAYIMQEVLSYPLFLWTVYVWYCIYEKQDEVNYKLLASCAILSVLCFYTKTYLIFIPIVINLLFIIEALKKEQRAIVCKRIAVYDLIYIICVAIFYVGVLAINDFSRGSNHYTTQFSNIFPITGWTIASGLIGIIIYGVLFLINTAIIPVPAIVFFRKKYLGIRKKLVDFTIVSCILLIVEIVVLVVLTEEGVPTIPHKFLFRYFQILVPLLLILFAKVWDKEEILHLKKIHIATIIEIIVAVCYFWGMQGKTRQAIMDGHLYLLLENLSKYLVRYADVVLMVVSGGILFGIFWVAVKRKKMLMPLLRKAWLSVILIFWALNCIQLPLYTNKIAGGKQIQSDSIQIANYLNENGYQKVYFIVDDDLQKNDYVRNFYGYIKQPYYLVDTKAELTTIMNTQRLGNAAFLVHTDYELEGDFKKVELETQKLDLYVK